MIVAALSILFVSVMIFMTMSIGQRAKDKVELQTMADTSALSSAVATARTFNTNAILNRAAISHWVAMMGTQALNAYATSHRTMLAGFAWDLELTAVNPPAPPPATAPNVHLFGGAACITTVAGLLNQAAMKFRLEMQATDTLNCNGLNWDQCDAAAAQQVRDIQKAIVRIENLEWRLNETLYEEVLTRAQHANVNKAANAAWGDQILVGGQTGCREVCHGSRDNDNDQTGNDDLDLTEHLDAAMGTKGNELLAYGTINDRAESPVPALTVLRTAQIQNALNSDPAYNAYVTFQFFPARPPAPNICAYFTNHPWGSVHGFELDKRGWRALGADVHNENPATMHFHGACAPLAGRSLTRTAIDGVELISTNDVDNVGEGGTDNIGRSLWPDVGPSPIYGNSHQDFIHGDGVARDPDYHFWTLMDSYETGPRRIPYEVETSGLPRHTLGARGHYERPDTDTLVSTPYRHLGVFRGGFGMLDRTRYPATPPTVPGLPPQGANDWVNSADLYAMPKMVNLLYRDRSAAVADPWALTINSNFRRHSSFSHTAQNATVADFQGGRASAFSSGLAYYHRRNHIGEPANMLNPYWRATLVPLDLDVHGRVVDGETQADVDYTDQHATFDLWNRSDVHHNDVMTVYGGGRNSPIPQLYEDMVVHGGFRGVP